MSARIAPTLLLAVLLSGSAFRAAEDASPKEVFEKRILPIFKSPNPSSCVQCHLAGVDLKNYILPSHEQDVRLAARPGADRPRPAREVEDPRS